MIEISTYINTNFQDFNCFSIIIIINFYDFIITLLFIILLVIFYIFVWFKINKLINLKILHNQLIEVIWTVLPVVVLFFMAVPSLKLLYYVEEIFGPYITLKILGHQWYWRYEYRDFFDVRFDSFINSGVELIKFRLLDVDNRLILPFLFKIRGLVSSMDVIHSWAIPSMGIKVDAVPGRINQFTIKINRPGLFFGQCSEICGLNHRFIPIVIERVSLSLFFSWIKLY